MRLTTQYSTANQKPGFPAAAAAAADQFNTDHHSFVSSQPALSPTSQDRKRKHFHWPAMCAYLVYDLSSPVFSTSELEAFFAPPPPPPRSSTTAAQSPTSPTSPSAASTRSLSPSVSGQTHHQSGDGWGTFLNSRIEHITHRSPTTKPTGICVGEYSSASVAHPCQVHGVGQIFHGWNDHPAVKNFKQMIASTPVIRPSGNGPAQILKAYLDEYTGRDDPLSMTWVMKFLLLPKSTSTADRWWEMRDWQDLCQPENLKERDFKPVALICVRRAGFQKDELARKFIEFGRLFSVEVVIVSSIG